MYYCHEELGPPESPAVVHSVYLESDPRGHSDRVWAWSWKGRRWFRMWHMSGHSYVWHVYSPQDLLKSLVKCVSELSAWGIKRGGMYSPFSFGRFPCGQVRGDPKHSFPRASRLFRCESPGGTLERGMVGLGWVTVKLHLHKGDPSPRGPGCCSGGLSKRWGWEDLQ